MQQFTLQVANALTTQIANLKEHQKKVQRHLDFMKSEPAGGPTLSLTEIPSRSMPALKLITALMPMTPTKVIDCYRAEIGARIEQMEYAFQQLNDDSAPIANSRFDLGILQS